MLAKQVLFLVAFVHLCVCVSVHANELKNNISGIDVTWYKYVLRSPK